MNEYEKIKMLASMPYDELKSLLEASFENSQYFHTWLSDLEAPRVNYQTRMLIREEEDPGGDSVYWSPEAWRMRGSLGKLLGVARCDWDTGEVYSDYRFYIVSSTFRNNSVSAIKFSNGNPESSIDQKMLDRNYYMVLKTMGYDAAEINEDGDLVMWAVGKKPGPDIEWTHLYHTDPWY